MHAFAFGTVLYHAEVAVLHHWWSATWFKMPQALGVEKSNLISIAGLSLGHHPVLWTAWCCSKQAFLDVDYIWSFIWFDIMQCVFLELSMDIAFACFAHVCMNCRSIWFCTLNLLRPPVSMSFLSELSRRAREKCESLVALVACEWLLSLRSRPFFILFYFLHVSII